MEDDIVHIDTGSENLNKAFTEMQKLAFEFTEKILKFNQQYFKSNKGASFYTITKGDSVMVKSLLSGLNIPDYSPEFMNQVILNQITSWFEGQDVHTVFLYIDIMKENILKQSFLKPELTATPNTSL